MKHSIKNFLPPDVHLNKTCWTFAESLLDIRYLYPYWLFVVTFRLMCLMRMRRQLE